MWPGVSEPVKDASLRVLSLGAGVQSTTLALLAAHGEIRPMPDVAIFADTGWEPQAVYDHLDWIEERGALPFPILRVQAIDLRGQILDRAAQRDGRFISVPFFLENGGINRRQCTREAKIDPVRKEIRRLLGLQPGQHATNFRVEQWIGISTDEMVRMKLARNPWIINRWPLIEQRMCRNDCLTWLKRHGYPEPPKSACIGCPYRSNQSWRDMKEYDPKSFEDAVQVDHALRLHGGARNMRKAEFMHRACRPLGSVDFHRSDTSDQLSFLDECDGVCGT
ncbi:hypothetical protein [Yoonia sp. R2-816]|uniref:hypothetical protein n=1 Tax=Yoonia sp. R2-816 TaxID=3342638 RepID=UPI00372A74F2